LPINPAVATLTLVPNTNLQVAQPGVVITESQATAEDQKLLKEVEKKIVTDLKSIEQEEQKKKIEEAAITNSPLVISLVNQTTSVTAFTQDEENSSETTILKLETINNNATEDFNDDSQEFDAENDSHVSSSIKIFSFGLLVVTISILNVFLA
jgi:type VI protein secretion system component VasF